VSISYIKLFLFLILLLTFTLSFTYTLSHSKYSPKYFFISSSLNKEFYLKLEIYLQNQENLQNQKKINSYIFPEIIVTPQNYKANTNIEDYLKTIDQFIYTTQIKNKQNTKETLKEIYIFNFGKIKKIYAH